MAFMTIEYYSKALGMERQVNVIYPDAFEIAKEEVDDKDIPVLYLLHGMGGNENSWRKRTPIERLLRHTNLIVVMPSTDLGWYTNTSYQMAYYDAIAIELPQVLHRFFPNMSTKRDKTFIAGLSMGGYGAFKIAMKTNRFSYAASFSGALKFDEKALQNNTDTKSAYWSAIFGGLDDKTIEANSLSTFAKASDKQTHYYAWCGYEDFLYEANQEAVEEFRELGLMIDYHTSHGKHEWYYWSKQLEALLEWLPINYVKEERLS
ncbi:alpha/beta hydrolase [Streptococcus sp. zg-JUN1979]|uniref:alpha/beta hydrolase n=1 Tax=Streptococcus sp. zg-JUN1979 TaxID=3391450 RepID=UPI0039A63DA6